MYKRTGGSLLFVQTEPMEEERIRMGWDDNVTEPYLKLYADDPKGCDQAILEADVVFFGGSDDESYVKERLKSGKVLFRYSERLYKTGQWKAISPRGLKKKYQDHGQYRNAPVYMLCAGAYVPSDFAIVRAYPGKKYCWGYFPEAKPENMEELLAQKGYDDHGTKVPYLLWAGRMIDWKHPELVIETAEYLKGKGLAFHLDVIGGGTMEEEIRRMVTERGLEDRVSLLGFMTPGQVREHMERADVYLFTSDRQEGWGAVANEAMNSGCALVADHMIGAAPYLIRHGENGLVYRDGDKGSLFAMAEELVRDPEKRRKLGRNAHDTIKNVWNAENAAERLCALIEKLSGIVIDEGVQRSAEKGEGDGFAPCDPAPVIPERKMYHYLTKDRKA